MGLEGWSRLDEVVGHQAPTREQGPPEREGDHRDDDHGHERARRDAPVRINSDHGSGRYPHCTLMTVLHVTPIGPDADAPEGTPLGRSLCAQTDGRWQWRTADPGPDDALVEIDTTTTLRSDAVALWLAGLASRPDAGAVYADNELVWSNSRFVMYAPR